jgi:SanA protein
VAPAAPGPGVDRAWAVRWARRAALAVAVTVALIAAADLYVVASTRARIVDIAAAPARPVAIVLGNRVYPSGSPSAGLAERLRAALALYQSGRVPHLIVSGAVHPEDGYDEPAVMAAWLEAHGVPAAHITLDRGGHRTAATMADAAALGVRQALICTQPYHLPRALYLAHRAGIDALGVAAASGRSEGAYRWLRGFVRETLARAETVVEVAVRGVGA